MIAVILVEPITAGNVGAIARVMKNFGSNQLFLVSPKCDHLCKEAMDRAKHAKDILKKARIVTLQDVRKKQSVLVATTARLGDQYNFNRIPLLPAELAAHVAQLSPKTSIGVVFGRESDGLTNEEIALCDFCVTIPTHPEYRSLNLSHAAAIILSQLYTPEKQVTEKFTTLTQKEKEKALELVDAALEQMTFPLPNMKQTQRILWQKLIGKSFLTKREGYALMSFLRKCRK